MVPAGPLNMDTSLAWTYHNATKHSEWSIRSNPHYLDWANQPLSLKIYTTLEPIYLPRDADQTGISALSAIGAASVEPGKEHIPALKDLARILYFSAGITKKKTFPGGEMYFRAASCTGALYEIELYVVCGDLPDLKAGVYHFGPGDFALRLLRAGDYRGVMAIPNAPAIIACTGTYWRNAWKYRARTYRHFGWDNGTIIANMLAMSSALQVPAQVHCGFVDANANRVLDLDTRREVSFSLVSVGWTEKPIPSPPAEMAPLDFPTVPLSKTEVDYPEMRAIHEASSCSTLTRPTLAAGLSQRERRLESIEGSTDSIERVILRRGSSRQFKRESITASQLMTILHSSTRGIPADFPPLNDLYLIINAVDGMEPGAYFYRQDTGEIELLKSGDFRNEARHLGLQQNLPGDAAAGVFFLADLHSILERFGNRGYRAVQLEAGIVGGKLYLASYALHLGATGLTFFDDDVTEFFSPHAQAKSAIFLVAIGKGHKA